MKTKIFLFLLSAFSIFLYPSFAQVPQGFNYQAIARDGSGNPIVNATINVRLSILSDSNGFYPSGGGTYVWEETHSSVKTNAFGLFTIVMGNPLAIKSQGTALSFSAIDWTKGPLYIGTKIANPTTYKALGAAQLWTVPYAMVASNLTGTVTKLNVAGSDTSMSNALFEVKNNNGQTVFAVYNEGVRIYVDDGVKGNKGGFAIGGFGTGKAPSQEYLRVTRDSSRIYVNPNVVKGTKGGFAIGGFGAKSGTNNYLNLTPNNYFIGQSSGSSITTGLYNSFFGYEAGKSNTNGMSNVMIGYQAGLSNTSGSSNLFFGTWAGKNNSLGENNVFLGNSAGFSNTGGVQSWMGSDNIFIGNGAGVNNTVGGTNIFMGTYAGLSNIDGNLNIYIGNRSGFLSKGVRNLFMGAYSGYNNSTGNDNIFIGNQAAEYSTTGEGNTFLGGISGWYNYTGNHNTYLGYSAGGNLNSGNENVLVGYQAGQGISGGDRNTLLGFSTGGFGSASGNVYIGYMAGKNETGSNRLYIENSGGDSNSALIYGEFDNDVIKLNGTVNIRDVLKLKPLPSAPANPQMGDIYFNSTTKKLMVYDGTAWQACW